MDSNQISNTLQDILSTKQEIVFVYLFGSVAKGSENKLSDIDIAIYLNKDNMPPSGNFGYKAELIAELEEKIEKEIDLVILNDVSLELAFNIIKDGKLVLCNSKRKRADFHFRTQRDYLDFKPFLQVQDDYLNEWLYSESKR
ncbi:putative nucleotidyltransferase [Halobacteroides halobius DSM 5150]|uniref:Putative nucleotidyltransferase n=1 Tax=Halobacteroides halobius (strain ATCC 35273 / DSM 5150 / MD-1) TaxID=748449 RepID=L0KB53_HALHC|nr:nucleotidyltransferase domain-containing protein [Halobacteroides halobius]AGB42246.1 putative nucleotidyltransferase [Halobacteroides halobius DSM 5150]